MFFWICSNLSPKLVEATTKLLLVRAAVVWKVSRSEVGTSLGLIEPPPLRGVNLR